MSEPSTVTLYPPNRAKASPSPLPQLLQTPSGLALLELQGSINLPHDREDGQAERFMQVGRIDFPEYKPDAIGEAWMKRVHLYIGQYQRLTGEVKKLPKPIAVVRRREGKEGDLEVVEIVKHKLIFSNRPEPVGTENAT